jgi:hypothetical protein
MKNGQASIETIISMGFVLIFILLFYTFLVNPRMQQSNLMQNRYSAQNICDDLSDAITLVAYNANGYTQKVSLPATLRGAQYNITVYPTLLSLEWAKNSLFCSFAAKNITYSGKFPPFTLDLTEHLLNNSNGVVKIV